MFYFKFQITVTFSMWKLWIELVGNWIYTAIPVILVPFVVDLDWNILITKLEIFNSSDVGHYIGFASNYIGVWNIIVMKYYSNILWNILWKGMMAVSNGWIAKYSASNENHTVSTRPINFQHTQVYGIYWKSTLDIEFSAKKNQSLWIQKLPQRKEHCPKFYM